MEGQLGWHWGGTGVAHVVQRYKGTAAEGVRSVIMRWDRELNDDVGTRPPASLYYGAGDREYPNIRISEGKPSQSSS